MKSYGIISTLIAITALLFVPISAYPDKANHAAPLAIQSGLMFPNASSGGTEQWEFVLDDGLGRGNCTLYEQSPGTVLAVGNWEYTYQGAIAFGPFTDAPVTISGKSVLITASGTATSPSTPPAYNTSPYTLIISGTAFNGQGSGIFTITYQATGWPNRITGVWKGTRISGSGVTEEEPTAAPYLPWLFLLLGNQGS